MFNYFLYFTGILFGIFLILIIISDKGYFKTLFINSKEYFNNNNANINSINSINSIINEKIDIIMPPFLKEVTTTGNHDDTNVVLSNSDIIDNFNFKKLLKRRDLKVLISSYNKDNINNLEWITDNKDYNNNIILKLSSNDITKELYNLNPLINGYNIQNVSIEGPSNTIMYSNDKTINKFSILFTFMYKKFNNNNNNLFIIYGIDNKNIVVNIRENKYSNEYYNVNNTNDNDDLNSSYDTRDTHDIDDGVNLLNNYHYYDNLDILSNKAKEQKSYKLSYSEKLYTIEIIIDDSIYNINNINMEKIKDDIIFLGLIMNIDDVEFHLNNFKYEFKRKSASEIKISKHPFIINKNKNCDIVLYSFAYFNDAISKKELNEFKLYNKYKLHGVDNINNDTIIDDVDNSNINKNTI